MAKRKPHPTAPPSDGEFPVVRRKITRRVRAFIHFFAESGFHDPAGAATAAGYAEPSTGYTLYERFRDLIERERLSRALGHEMELDEGLHRLAQLARQDEDRKVALAAVRTVLEVKGALSDKLPASDRRALAKKAEALLGELRKALAAKPEMLRALAGRPGEPGEAPIDVEARPADATPENP